MSKYNELIGQWFFKNLVEHKGPIPNPQAARFFMKNLMNIAAADGNLTDKERQWIIGFAAACGNPKEVIDELEAYQPGRDTQLFKVLLSDLDKDYVKMTRRSMVYNAIRAAGADDDLNEAELKAIYELAEQIDVTNEQVRQVQDVYEEEKEMRKKRNAILFPQGFATVLNKFDKEK